MTRILLAVASLSLAAAAGADELPHEWHLAGQIKTCADGPIHRTFTLTAHDQIEPIGMSFRADQMEFTGAGRPPVLEACVGDTVTLLVENADKMAHGIDSHAFFIAPEHFGPVDAGGSLSYTGVMTVPGAFMFHCASGPVTDVHIKSGMVGEMVVYPRTGLRPAKEIAIVQGGFWGDPDSNGLVSPDTTRIMHNDPWAIAFNGRLEHETVHVRTHELIRVYFVNAGPGASSVHVMGTMLERFYPSGNPENVERDVQTGLVPAGGGASFELRLPEPGMYMLVDHDNLRFVPLGMAIPLMAE